MTKTEAKTEAKKNKKLMPAMYYASYELFNGQWQSVSAWTSKRAAKENIKFHANGKDYFIV
jgi:hypothetical protein